MDLLIIETIELLKACVAAFVSANLVGFLVVLAVAFFLAIATWWACSAFAKLWNTKFSIGAWHHVLCAISALIVFATVLLGASLRFTEAVADSRIESWAEGLKFDEIWKQDTFTKVYDGVKSLGQEDFNGYTDPRDGGNRVPVTLSSSQETVATVYVESSIIHFQRVHPILSLLLLSDEKVPQAIVLSDVRSFFNANPGSTYPAESAIRLAVNHVKSGLSVQTPVVVLYSRLILGGIFLVLIFLTLTAISLAAYNDIKIHNANA